MSGPGARPWRVSARGVVLALRLTPKSSRDEIEGVATHDDMPVLKARVRALPDKGEANTALEKLIARWLGVPRSKVALLAGGKSRLKSVVVEGEAAELAEMLESRLASL
jgi:uncharacterized protein YggU (UPF0235/DUF167 family)